MKRFIALLLAVTFLISFPEIKTAQAEEESIIIDDLLMQEQEFSSLNDPELLQYVEDSVYEQLDLLYSDQESMYNVDDVSVVYVSKEYLEETSYNTKANIFFGYTLDQIDKVFQGAKYVFTLSEAGETVVQEFMEIPNDTYNRIIKNVLIGTGIILVCVTVSVLTAGAAAPAAGGTSAASLAALSTVSTATKVHLVFAASAHSAATFAASGAVFAGATTMLTRGLETGWDIDAMTESAALSASEGFKWGAVSGAVTGGAKEAFRIKRTRSAIPSPQEAEQAALNRYGGRTQVSYKDGKEVSSVTKGATRPDLVIGNEAIEVKRYSLSGGINLNNLRRKLEEQVADRVKNLPKGMTQRIVLDVEGRGYTQRYVNAVIKYLQKHLEPIYHGTIPIDVIGKMI